MPDSLRRQRFVMSGRVQGVGFRWFVRDWAERLALHGWVRNRENGSVEAEAEGQPEALTQFARHLRAGPAAARVDAIVTEALNPEGGAEGFDIL